ncbi:MAG: M50 family metallopeptidase [Mycobacteriales bacterium]
MSWFAAGIALFALGILVSVCIHEAGHMLFAKAFGMKVTRYFVGFGPTLWSFRRGETEYGIKAIPAGGFVKIVGMTPHEEDIPPEDEHRAFWRRPVWQKTVVLVAGSASHFVLGFLVLWIMATFIGVPNNEGAPGARAEIGGVASCVQRFDAAQTKYLPCTGSDAVSPAKQAGIAVGDVVTSVNGEAIGNYPQMARALDDVKSGPVTLTLKRGGDTRTLTMTPADVTRLKRDATVDRKTGRVDDSELEQGRIIGVTKAPTVTVSPLGALAAGGYYTKVIFTGTFTALKEFPEKIPKLWDALLGAERDPNTPVSVVGASIIGGEAAEAGIWGVFLFLLATLNIFVGIFNLLPLLPLDGGHIAIAWFQKVRSWLALKRGRPDPGLVDYNKLMPLTYAVILVFGSISLLTLATDIVNPISLYGP